MEVSTEIYQSSSHLLAKRFMNDPKSVTPDEAFAHFCDLFDVEENQAAQYFNGRKFEPIGKK